VSFGEFSLKVLPGGNPRQQKTIQISVDGEILGVLNLSSVGVTWMSVGDTPKSYLKDWYELRNFMESPDNERVDDVPALLRATESESLEDLANYLCDRVESEDDFWFDGTDESVDEVGLFLGSEFSTNLTFPCNVGELWTAAAELDRLLEAKISYTELAAKISEVERFPVEVEVDQDDHWKSDYCDEVLGWFIITEVDPYPYRRAMSGSKTVDEWMVGRFEPNYPGFELQFVTSLPTFSNSTLLSELRAEAKSI